MKLILALNIGALVPRCLFYIRNNLYSSGFALSPGLFMYNHTDFILSFVFALNDISQQLLRGFVF